MHQLSPARVPAIISAPSLGSESTPCTPASGGQARRAEGLSPAGGGAGGGLVVIPVFIWFLLALGFWPKLQAQPDTAYFSQLDRKLNEQFRQGKQEEALETLRQMDQLAQQWFSPDSILFGNLERSYCHVFHELHQFDSALHHGRKALSEFRRIQGPDDRYTIDTQYDLAYVFNADFQFDSAVYHFKASIQKYEVVLGDSTDDLPLAHHNLAALYQGYGLHEAAIRHEKLAYDIWLRLYGRKHHRILSACTLLSRLYMSAGKTEQALLYRFEALNIAEELFTDNPIVLAREYLETAKAYSSYGGENNRLKNLRHADSLLQTIEDPPASLQGQIYHHWGQYYKGKKDFAQARPYLTRAIAVLQPYLATQRLARIQVADYHTTYAQALKDEQQHDSALFHLERAFLYYQDNFSQRQYYIYFERADNYFLLGDTAAFFREAQHLISFFQQGKASTEHSLIALLQKNLEIYPDIWPVKVMLRLADRLWELYEQYPSENHLQLATAAFSQLDRWYGPYIQENLRLTTLEAEYRSWIYKGLLRSYAESYRLTGKQEALARAFEASERNKGFSLRRHLRQQSLLNYAGLPDSLVGKDAAFRAQIAFLSAHLKRLQFQAEAQEQEARYQEKLLAMQESYESFRQELKTGYPQYLRMLDQQPVSLDQFQQSLKRDQNGLIYARADSVLFIFHIRRDLAAMHQSRLPANLEDQIQSYRYFLHDYHPRQYAAIQDSMKKLGQQFQDLFLFPREDLRAEETSSLLCIPDDVLSFLPFEVLPGMDPEFPFLVNQYPIGYAYSASLFVDQQNHQPSSRRPRLAAFAPSYQEDLLASLNQTEADQMRSLVREGWFDLQGARQEASAIVSQFEGDLIQGQSASKDTFLRLAPHYQLLHLAMHASVKPQTPLLSSLIFARQEATIDSSKQMLFATDLLPLRLKADLVVLSACNTGYGKIKAGEGAESLAKAFHYAGSPAVVMSLWKVPDRETRIIMEAFYGYLHEGRNKAEALREAKLDYLAQTKAPELRHPFFWAGFVLSGNAEPLPDGEFPWWGYVLILMGMIAIFLLARKQLGGLQMTILKQI